MKKNYYQIADFYPHLKNPKKYVGTRPLTCRSGWEIQYSQWMDKHPSVLEWASETIVIPYISPLDGKWHRYFTDYWMKVTLGDGTIKEYLVEIKPYAEVQMAENFVPPKRMTKNVIKQIHTAMKNKAKWQYARAYCAKESKAGRNIEFTIVTEKDGIFKL